MVDTSAKIEAKTTKILKHQFCFSVAIMITKGKYITYKF